MRYDTDTPRPLDRQYVTFERPVSAEQKAALAQHAKLHPPVVIEPTSFDGGMRPAFASFKKIKPSAPEPFKRRTVDGAPGAVVRRTV